MINPKRRSAERGSALLIVFVFAAMLAIMLYREMPVASFEAQRQKEELLMDRGNEYKRAIKLYVRKFQTFPASLEALENTNRMRFLRNRYVDPFTGKDDWRLLHAGPGGLILDSKIKQKTPDPNTNGGPNSATTPNSGFAGSPTSSASASSTDPAALLNGQPGQPGAANAFPQRPPAMALNGGGPAGGSNGELAMPMPAAPQDPQSGDPQSTPPIPAAAPPYPGYPGPPIAPIPGQTDGNAAMPQTAQPSPAADGSVPFPALRQGRIRNGNLAGDPNAAIQQQYLQASQQQFGGAAIGNSQDPQAMMQALINNNNPKPNAQTGLTGSNAMTPANASTFSGTMNQGNPAMGGGIAGVASKSKGPTIKVLDDQSERSLWEFVYDMRKEALANAPGAGNGTGTNRGAGGMPTTTGMNPGFNSTNQNSSFGNSFPAAPQSSNQ